MAEGAAPRNGWGTIRPPAVQQHLPTMLRPLPRKAIQAWLILALALASLLVGRPLHEALHLAAPDAAQVALALDEPTPESPPTETGTHAGGCVWCLLHAEALHPAPAFAAAPLPAPAATAPPNGLRAVVPTPAEIRAAPPRGPPQA